MCAFVQLRVRGASAWVCGVRLSGCGVRLHEHLVRFVIHSPQYVQERLCLRTRPARYVTCYGVLSVGPSRRSCSFCTQKKLFFLYSASSIIGHDWPDLEPNCRRGPSPLMSSLSRFRGRIYFNWVYFV